MTDETLLSDTDVHDRLVAAVEALGRARGATVHGQTAIAAARRALTLFQIGLVAAMEREAPTDGSSPPGP